MEMIPAKVVHLQHLVKLDLLFALVLVGMNLQEHNAQVRKQLLCDYLADILPSACMEAFYKDYIGNTTCTPCPPFSDAPATGSNTLSNCTCTLSSGTAEERCYGNSMIVYSELCLPVVIVCSF